MDFPLHFALFNTLLEFLNVLRIMENYFWKKKRNFFFIIENRNLIIEMQKKKRNYCVMNAQNQKSFR